jgi:iron complex transport system substrate-binding protein
MLFELGLGKQVIAVTHECDWPTEAGSLPHLTRSVIPDGLPSSRIDAVVRETVGRGDPLYELDRELLEQLAPDLVVTQAVCEVCAVSYDDVVAVAAALPSRPRVLSLDPVRLDDVLRDFERLGGVAGADGAGRRLAQRARERIEAVRSAVAEAERRRVLALEWLDPPFVAGHWVPEMVAIAGGSDVLAEPGARSRVADWDELRAAAPEAIVVMPCGYDRDGAMMEAKGNESRLSSVGAAHVLCVDASAYFSRPGPRLVDGIELLGHFLHPELVARPDGYDAAASALLSAARAT